MTAALIAALSLLVLGLPVALALDRRAAGPLLLGTAFLYGSGLIFLVLMLLSIVHVRWTVVTVTIVGLLGCSVAWLLSRLTPRQPSNQATQQPRFHWLDLAT